jgi:hypothetical protein
MTIPGASWILRQTTIRNKRGHRGTHIHRLCRAYHPVRYCVAARVARVYRACRIVRNHHVAHAYRALS